MKTRRYLTIALFICTSLPVSAWIYPEHRDIAIAAINKLDPARRAILNQLWAQARMGYESRLCQGVIEPDQGMKPTCLDFAAWPAIGGDHSVSAQDMTNIVLKSEWILKVADIAAWLKTGIKKSRNQSERISYLRDSDIKLLWADPGYVSRAGKNNGHFLLARPEVNPTPVSYFELCFRPGTEMNTVGTYSWYHMSAISKAALLKTPGLTPEQRSAIALSALADEGFALHFLEDSYCSGHVAGVWGDAANRKGTHDYYNEKGLEVTTWNHDRMVLMGDAYMTPEDLRWTSEAVRKSLEQVLDAAAGSISVPDDLPEIPVVTPDTFNVSKAMVMPVHPVDSALRPLCDTVLIETPVPGLARGLGALPRYRAEIGPFIGLHTAASSNIITRGFMDYQDYPGAVSGLEIGVRMGLGMEGVLNESGDGLVFLDLGWRIDAASSSRYDYNNEPILQNLRGYAAAIPSRDAYYLRLRLPFFLIPGDLIILAPILALTSPGGMQKVITAAGNGGLIPWQTGLNSRIGRFQFVLGREVAIDFYGSGSGPDPYLVTIYRSDPAKEDDIDLEGYYSLYSTKFEFPIVEYRPFRTYSSRQTGSLLFQIHAGFDVPGKRGIIWAPDALGNILPPTQTIWYAGLRIVFDYRYYFSGKKR